MVIRQAKSISIDDSLAVKPILDLVFEPTDVEKLMSAINDKINHYDAQKDGCPKQVHAFLDCYLQEDAWDLMLNKEVDVQMKLMGMSGLFAGIGLLQCEEKRMR